MKCCAINCKIIIETPLPFCEKHWVMLPTRFKHRFFQADGIYNEEGFHMPEEVIEDMANYIMEEEDRQEEYTVRIAVTWEDL